DFVIAATHEALDGEHSVLRVGNGLPFGDLPDQALAALGKADNRWGGPSPFLIRNDGGLAGLHHRDAGVRRAQINSDNFTHVVENPPLDCAMGKKPRCRSLPAHLSTTLLLNFSVSLSSSLRSRMDAIHKYLQKSGMAVQGRRHHEFDLRKLA